MQQVKSNGIYHPPRIIHQLEFSKHFLPLFSFQFVCKRCVMKNWVVWEPKGTGQFRSATSTHLMLVACEIPFRNFCVFVPKGNEKGEGRKESVQRPAKLELLQTQKPTTRGKNFQGQMQIFSSRSSLRLCVACKKTMCCTTILRRQMIAATRRKPLYASSLLCECRS